MSRLAYKLDIRQNASGELNAVLDFFEPQRLSENVGKAATKRVQMHLQSLDQAGNKLGGKRTHYYSDQASATSYKAISSGAIIGIGEPNKGLALHFWGGDLGPENLRNAKNYAIPARAESHGKVPSDFGGALVLLYGRNGPYALAYMETAPRMRKDGKGRVKDKTPEQGQGEVLFWLTKHLHFEADPTVLPTEADIHMAVVGALYSIWQTQYRAGGKN